MGKEGAEEKRKMDIKRSLKFRTCAIAIILFTLLFSALTIPSFNVLAQNQAELDVLDETEPEPEPTPELTPEPTPESTPEPATEEIISANLANASLITDKRIYSQGESVNISLLYVPSTATTNLTILSPSPGDIVYIALEEETGLYSFTETNAIGTYLISANISVALETLTLTTEFVVVGEEGKEIGEGLEEKGEERGFNLNKASLSVDKATYALGETVRICLAAPPEVITNFSIINPAGIFYGILPSPSGKYEFNPDSAGKYVVKVSLRNSADGDEKFLILTAGFDVIDLGLEIVFEEPEQGEIEVGEPVKWRQHISITNHGNVSISNYAVNIPLPEDYSNLSSDARDARYKIQDASQACILHPASCISVSIDLAAGENLDFNIFYQTSPVTLEVVETSIDISDLIPPDAFDVGIYKQIEAGEEIEEVFSLRLSESEVKVKQVTVTHNSSVHYHDIPVCIEVEAEANTKVVELVNGTEKEIKAKISDKNVSWMVPELSKSKRTFMITKPELIPEQAKAEIDTPVEWQLNVLGTLIRYRTPAPFKTESAPKIENGTWKKEVVIGSNASVHYSNVTAFTNLSVEGDRWKVEGERFTKLFLNLSFEGQSPSIAFSNAEKKALPKKQEAEERSRIDVTDNPAYNVSFVDTDDNGLIDQVRWNVPFLSNKTTFEVECAHYTLNLTPVLTAKRKHFSFDEKPEFSFEYITEEEEEFKAKKVGGGLATLGERYNKKALKTLVTPKETIKTFVYDYKGELTDIEPEIEELREGKFAIKLPKERAFRAGIYKLKVELIKDGVTYTQEQDFTWGVLAINTHKSIYLPNEIVDIGIAVLDNEGHMVCDADVTLTITDPGNKETVLSTNNGLIKVSPECSVYGITNLPDYYTNYGVSGVGTYVMNLTAVTADGTRSITDNFDVQSLVDFDVARDGPTRIYPSVPYVMNFTIKANRDYMGLIKEYVPASFVITPQEGLTVTTVGDTKILSWNKNLVEGETYNIYYEFDAPDVSPYLFTLGALEIGSFKEARQWQIASDTIFVPSNIAHDVDIAILDDATGMFVLAWCNGTDNSALYQVFYTNGTNYSSANKFDTGAGDSCRIAVTALNSTAFVINYAKYVSKGSDWIWGIYDIDDNIIKALTAVDVNTNDNVDAGVCTLNESRYVLTFLDDKDDDLTFEIWDMSTEIAGQNDALDNNVDPTQTDEQRVDCAGLNSTAWVFAGYDEVQAQIIFDIFDEAGNSMLGRTIVDASTGSAAVATAGLANGGFVIAYCDDDDDDLSFQTYDKSGTGVSGIVDVDQDITDCAGAAGTKVEVHALDTTDSQFVIIFDNTTGDSVHMAVYNYSGDQILAPHKLDDTNAPDKAVAVAGFDVIQQKTVCKHVTNPVIVAYNNQTGPNAVWKTILANGSSWDGVCIDTTAPRVVLIHPWGTSCADHYHDVDSDVDITVDVTDLTGVDTILANITFPNQTLSINLSGFDYGLQSDDFETDTEGLNWVHANSTLAGGQSCYTDINTTYPGKMFIALDGNGTGPGMHCAFNSIKRVNGNYDLTLSFNATYMEDDTFFTLRSAPTDSMYASGLRVYIALLQDSVGDRIYRLAYYNGTATYQENIPTIDTHGKFRIKRSNMTTTGTPIFNLYYWNNSGNDWIESSFGNISIPGCSRIHFIQIKPGSSASNYGALNVTIDDFHISGDNYKFAIFNQTADTGTYNVTIIANDTLGYVNDTVKSDFEIEEINYPPTRPYFEEPDKGDVVSGLFNIIWGKVSDDENDNVRFNITLLNSDGSYNSTIVSDYGDINTYYYPWDTSNHSDGLYSMNITVYENETAEGLNTSDTLDGNFTIDNTPPRVVIIHPLEHIFDEYSDLAITVDAIDLTAVDTILANVTFPNQTLSINLSGFDYGLPSDDFETDTEGVNWVKKNITSSGQSCIVDINSTVPEKMFISVDGGTGPTTAQCGFNSLKRLDGDFDVNISFDISVFENDTLFSFRSNSRDTFSAAGLRVFTDIEKDSSGVIRYTFGYNNGSGTTDTSVITTDTSGKFRIKRYNTTETPTFNLYYWNNTGETWVNLLGDISLPGSARVQFIQVKPASVASNYGMLNITLDNFSFSGDAYKFAIFNQTSETGIYNFTIIANDTLGYVNDSESSWFNVTEINDPPSRPFITEPGEGDTVSELFNISWSQVTDEEEDSLQFNITLLYPNGTDYAQIASNYGDNGTTYYQWNTSNHSDGLYSLRIMVFENETAEGLSTTETLGGNFTIDNTPPAISIDAPTNESPVYRKGGGLFYVNFTYTEENPKNYTVKIYNCTATINSSSNTTYTPNSYVNESFNLNSTAAVEWYNVSVEMYDNASIYNISYQNNSVVKWGWSNVTWISPPNSSSYTVGKTITLTCLVRDANSSSPIANYPVHFYNRTDSTVTYDFGVNYTNSSGYAVMDWDTTGVALGWYYPKCNITDNSTLFYNVSAPYEVNTSIKLAAPVTGTETLTPDSLTGIVDNELADVQSSNDSRIGVDTGKTGGVTFTNTLIPAGSTINSVVIYYEHWEEAGHTADSITIRCGNSTDASAFGSGTVTDNIGPNSNTQGEAVPAEDTDSFTCSTTPSLSQLNDLQVEFFNNDGGGSDEMWIDYVYAVVDYYTPVAITFISQYPAAIYENSTGPFNVTWLITTDVGELNSSSVSLVWTVWDSVRDEYHWSLRVPSNNKSAVCSHCGEQIIRADNRNSTTQRLNFEDNVTITEGNVWKWAGADENITRLTIQPINSSHSYVHWNGTFEDTVFENMYYLDRTRLERENSKHYNISKNDTALIKFWDGKAIHGATDYKIHVLLNATKQGTPSAPLQIYYLNESYVINGSTLPHEDGTNATYLMEYNSTTVNDYTYTQYNSSFVKFTINVSNGMIGPVNATPHGYIYFQSQTEESNAYRLAYVNGASGKNISFAETNVAWTSSDNGATFTQAAWTPKLFLDFSYSGQQHQMKLYAADTSDNWGNSTLLTNDIGLVYYPPTTPNINHFHYAGAVDYDMDGSYTGTFEIGIGVATDPDGGNVTHNLTLHYGNETFVAIINSTFNDTAVTHDGIYADISFDASPYSSVPNYTLRCVATDDEEKTSETWLGVNFTFDHQSPTITIDEPTESPPVYRKGGEQFYVNFTYTEENPKNYTVKIYNCTATINSSSNTAYTPNSYVNESFYLNSTAADGWYNVSVEMYDNAANYNISYQNESVVKMSWSNVTWILPPDPSEYTVGESITLTCLVRDANTSSPIENYPVHFYNRTDSTVTHDFGVNYTNSSGYAVMDWDTTGVSPGWYYPKCNITDNATLLYNVSTPYEANTSIELLTTPLDLRVVSITFDNWETAENKASVSETGTGYHVKEGVNITVNATIANYGTGNVTSDFDVSFFDSAGVSGDWNTWFGNYTYNVSAEGELGNTNTGYPYNTTYAITYWDPSLVGTHNISAWADPDNSAGELATNVTDNNASALINVSAWQKYWGNVSGSIVLASAAASNMSTWEWPVGSIGNLYIVNPDATINWSALHALGYKTDDTQATDDFLEADINLGMNVDVGSNNATGFTNNNITELFSTDGAGASARNTTSFTVYGKLINNVSIINSTDMTNHTDVENAIVMTGILWDTSDDDGDGEYDTSDPKEDLVFIANIRYDADDIDYKIAIPCALNAAIGGDLDFYVELR